MRNGRKLPTVERLREALSYDPVSGLFTWIVVPKKASRVKVGDTAGNYDGRYVNINLDRHRFSAHRAALAIVNGEWPTSEAIDHIDGDKSNNRIGNLREASNSLNQQNQRNPHKSNSTGLLGVVPVTSRKSSLKFRAQIYCNGKAVNLGYFATPIEAHKEYVRAKRLMHAGCTL